MPQKKSDMIPPVTFSEIDLIALVHNLRVVRRLASRNKFRLPSRPRPKRPVATDVLAVIKADAYGHGVAHVAGVLDQQGVSQFAVSNIHEAIRLRQLGIKKPILLFESTLPQHIPAIVAYDLMPTVATHAFAEELNRVATARGKYIHVHVKVDTGMGRMGIWHENAFEFVQGLHGCDRLTIYGIYTHFPAADTDRAFTHLQLTRLYDVVTRLDTAGLVIPYVHASNSMGLVGYQTHIINVVRPGLMLYGLYPSARAARTVSLKPVMSIRSTVLFVKELKKGCSVSYGRSFIAPRDMTIAIIPIGYSDGYFRSFSNRAFMLIKGIRCPVIGRVTMDQTVVDVSKVRACRIGTPVVILGRDRKEEITADDLGQWAGTINYEIACNLGNRLPRVVKGGNLGGKKG